MRYISYCRNLEVIPAHMNLASLKDVYMAGTSRLRKFPVISTHIKSLGISNSTELEDVPASIGLWCRLRYLWLSHNEKLKGITHLPTSLTQLDLRYTDIERIPDCIKDLHKLFSLYLSGCRRLPSLPKLPCALRFLKADGCESLETVFSPLYPDARLEFTNCFKLGGEARTAIIRRPFSLGSALLPGKQVPAEFDHRAKGNSLTTILDDRSSNLEDFTPFTVCVVISPNQEITEMNDSSKLVCRINRNLYPYDKGFDIGQDYKYQKEHLFIFNLLIDNSEAGTEIKLELSSTFQDFDIIECGVKIGNPRSIRRRYLDFEDDNETEDENDRTNRVTREEFDQIVMDEIVGSNNAGCGDEDEGKNYMCSHEETSDEEDYDDDTAGGRFESESDEEEDDDEDYESCDDCVNKCSRVKLLNIIVSSFIVFCLACIYFYQFF